MPTLKLTDLAVQTVNPTKRTDYWDAQLPGFGLRVGARSKTFMVKKENRRVSLGRYPALSLKEARKKAYRLLASDFVPVSRITYSEALEEFVARHCKINNKPSTAHATERLLRRVSFKKPMAEIGRREIYDAISGFPPGEANHIFVALKTLFNWCLARDYVLINPLARQRLPHKITSRDRVLTDEELVEIWNAGQDFGYPFGHLVALLILTGQRLNEIYSLRRSWISDVITFPPEVVKNNSRHTIPLTPHAQRVIASIAGDDDRLFPNFAVGVAMRKFRRRLSLPHWTLHDLRRTYSTAQARLGTPPDITEAILNHKTGSRSPIQRIYDRYDRMEPMRVAMVKFESFLSDFIRRTPSPL